MPIGGSAAGECELGHQDPEFGRAGIGCAARQRLVGGNRGNCRTGRRPVPQRRGRTARARRLIPNSVPSGSISLGVSGFQETTPRDQWRVLAHARTLTAGFAGEIAGSFSRRRAIITSASSSVILEALMVATTPLRFASAEAVRFRALYFAGPSSFEVRRLEGCATAQSTFGAGAPSPLRLLPAVVLPSGGSCRRSISSARESPCAAASSACRRAASMSLRVA